LRLRRLPPAADQYDAVADAKAFQKFFTDKFFQNGKPEISSTVDSMNEDLHRQW